jgi:hypothetical protein
LVIRSLFDSLRQFLTPYPRAVKAMGFPAEVAGIQCRYKRCKDHWAEHIQRTRAVVLGGAERAEQRRKAIILGGGLVHDLPLNELAAMFREVILVDLIHPAASRALTDHLLNVKRVTADITEALDEAYRVAWDADQPLPKSEPTLFLDDPEIDFTASVNLLSQLPCMPMTYLNRQNAHPPDRVDEFARGLIRGHFGYLARQRGKVTLVTDVERLKISAMGQIVERRDLFFGIPWPTRGEEWEWKLAPCPEADRSHHYYRRVMGIHDWK